MTVISSRIAAQKILLARFDGEDPVAQKQSRRKRPIDLDIGAVIQQCELKQLEPREIGQETVRILGVTVAASSLRTAMIPLTSE